MASKILVDELAPYSHATDVTLATGKKIAGANTQFKITGGSNLNHLQTDGAGNVTWVAPPAGGKVLNVVTTTVTSAATSTSSTTFEDLPGLTVTISPTATTSNILIFVNLQVSGSGGGGVMVPMRLLRDSTPIFIGDQLSSNRGRGAFNHRAYSHQTLGNYSGTYYDEAISTTSATVYKMQWATETGGYYGQLNQANAGSDILKYSTGSSTITVMEIGV